MKKIISIFLISTLILTLLCGCGGSENNVSSDVSQIEAVINMSSEETLSEIENASSVETLSETENNSVQTIEKYYSNATIDDDFDSGSVLVVLNKETSKQIDRVFTAEDFGLDNCESIERITTFSEAQKQYAQKVWAAQEKEGSSFNYESIENPTLLNLENFRAIIKINLKDKSKENVLKAIKHLEKVDFVYCAEPNYTISLDIINENDGEIDEQ